MTITPRDRRVILIGSFVVALLLGGHYVLMPWLDRWQAARGQIVAAQTTLAAWEAREQRRALQHQRLGELLGEAVHQPLPSAGAVRVQFPNALQELLQRAGVTIRTMHPQPSRALPELPDVALVSIQLEAQCQLPQLARALAELGRADQLILVNRLTATAVPNRAGHVDVSMSVATPAGPEPQP